MKLIKRVCPTLSDIDKRIEISNLSPERILILRGCYDSYHDEPLIPDNVTELTDSMVEEAKQKLIQFRQKLTEEEMRKHKNYMLSQKITTDLAKTLLKIHDNYDAKTAMDRIQAVANIFHACLENFKKQKGLIGVNNTTVINEYFHKPSNLFYSNDVELEKFSIRYCLRVYAATYAKKAQQYKDKPEFKEIYSKLIYCQEEILKMLKPEVFSALSVLATPLIKENDGVNVDLTFESALSEFLTDEDFVEVEKAVDEIKKEGWQIKTDEISSYKELDYKIKNVFKFIQKFDENGKKITDDLNFSIYKEPSIFYKELVSLSQQCENEADLLQTIKDNIEADPSYKMLYDRLENNPDISNALYQALILTNIKYKYYDEGEIKELTGNFTTKNTLFKNWYNKAKRKPLKNSIYRLNNSSAGETLVDNNARTNFVNFLKEYFSEGEDIFSQIGYKTLKLKDKKNVLKKALNYLSIDVTDEQIAHIISAKKDRDLVKHLNKLYNVKALESNQKTMKGLVYNTVNGYRFLEEAYTNILYALKKAEPIKSDYSVRFLDKTLFNNILPSLLSDMFDNFKKIVKNDINKIDKLNNTLKQTLFKSSQFKKGDKIYNRLLRDLYYDGTNPQIKECVLNIISNLSISRMLGSKTEDFSDFSETLHSEVLFKQFIKNYNPDLRVYITEEDYSNLIKSGKVVGNTHYYIEGKNYYYKGGNNYYKGGNNFKKHPKNDFADFSAFIMGDKNQLINIQAPRYSYNECVEGLYDLALSEINYYKTITAFNEHQKSKELTGVKTNNKVFGLLTFLNDVVKPEDIGNISIDDNFKTKIQKAIKEFIKSESNKLKISDDLMFSKFDNKFVKLQEDEVKKLVNDIKELYVANYALNLACIQQLTIISPTLFKNTKDEQKRYKGVGTNGRMLNTNAVNPITNKEFNNKDYQKCVIFKDIKISEDEKFLKSLEKNGFSEEYINAYKENSLTDGQGYRLIDSYYKIMIMSGEAVRNPLIVEWYDTYKKLQEQCFNDDRDTFTADEIKQLEDIGYIPQPLKPITEALNTVNLNTTDGEDTLYIAQQHKYAEVILIPEMMPKGSKLKSIGQAMQGNNPNDILAGRINIDLAMFDSCVKFGAHSVVDVYKDENGNERTEESIKELLEDSRIIHNVGLQYFKLQVNVPYHISEYRGVGTQLKKMLFQGLDFNKSYDYLSDKLNSNVLKLTNKRGIKLDKFSGHNFIQLYNGLISANYIEDFERFKKFVSNKTKLSNNLIKQTIFRRGGNLNNVLNYAYDGEEFYNPLFDPLNEHSSISSILSTFRNIVNKQTMFGGSGVQASAFGISNKEESDQLHYLFDENGNINGAECEITWNQTVTLSNGEIMNLNYDDYCNEDGTLKYTNDGKVKLEVDFPDSTKLIAYRIPTENLYSVMNLKIVRFTRPSAQGGTIKVPVGGVTQAGFDFDIDKLYFLRKEFKELEPYFKRLNISSEEKNKIMLQIQQDNPEFLTTIDAITEETFSESQLYDIFSKIYENYSELYEDLTKVRLNSGEYKDITLRNNKVRRVYTHSLNYYFEQSSVAKKLAKNKGFDSVKDLKQFLVSQAAIELNYVPDTLVTIEDEHLILNEENITKAGLSKREVFENAAQKLNIKVKENLNNKYEEYDCNKTILKNTRTSRNNLIFDLVWSRMSDNETIKLRLTPGGFKHISKTARTFREIFYNTEKVKGKSISDIEKMCEKSEDPEPNYSPISVNTLIIYNTLNQIADKLIGLFANHNSNAVISSVMTKLEIKESIKFGSFLNGNVKLFKNGKELTNDQLGKNLIADEVEINGEKRSITDLIHEFLAAAVDAVKDPSLNYLGINIYNASCAAFLARLGYDVNDIALLFRQPIIELLNKHLEKGEYIDNAYFKIMKEIKDLDSDESNTELNSQTLLNAITANLKDDGNFIELKDENFKDIDVQIAVLNLYMKINGYASELNNFVNVTKNTASASVSTDVSKTLNVEHNNNKILDEFKKEKPKLTCIAYQNGNDIILPIINDNNLSDFDNDASRDEYLNKLIDSPYGFEQTSYDCNKFVLDILSDEYPYKTMFYTDIRDSFYRVSKHDKLDDDTLTLIHRGIILKTLANYGTSYFNYRNKLENGKSIYKYFVDDFPLLLLDMKANKELMRKYPFLDYLDMNPINDNDSRYIIKIENIKDDTNFKYLVSSMLSDMYFSDDKLANSIAVGIIYHHIFTRGFNYTKDSYDEILPPEIMHDLVINDEGTTFSEVLKLILDNSIDFNIDEFMIQFVQNNFDNKYLVQNVKLSEDVKIDNIGNTSTFSLNFDTLRDLNLIKNVEDDYVYIKPFLNVGGKLYVHSNSVNTGLGIILNNNNYPIVYKQLNVLTSNKNMQLYYSDSDNVNLDSLPTNLESNDSKPNEVENVDFSAPDKSTQLESSMFYQLMSNYGHSYKEIADAAERTYQYFYNNGTFLSIERNVDKLENLVKNNKQKLDYIIEQLNAVFEKRNGIVQVLIINEQGETELRNLCN